MSDDEDFYSLWDKPKPANKFEEWYFGADKAEPVRVANPAPRPLGVDGHPYGYRAMELELEVLSGTPNGKRNDQLNICTFSLAQLVAAGYLAADTTYAAIHTVAVGTGLEEIETRNTMTSAWEAGMRQPREVANLAEPYVPHVVEIALIDEAEFWAARPVLTRLHDFARARRAAPWAVLGVAFARVVVATPPMVVLPPLVGGDASLNLFVAIVGASGSGKGAAVGVATEALPVGVINSFPVGSGEGLTHLFVKHSKSGIEQHTTAILSDVAEVDTLTALNKRQGSTLQSTLRQVYMGEEFGFAYADPTKRLLVGAHAYRLALIVGVQPKRAAALLDDVDGGTPQRFLWLPAQDPGAPDVAPAAPSPWKWTAPPLPLPGASFDNHRPIPVCDTARAAVDAARLANMRGVGSALDGHALLGRLKAAAALALLDGRAEVGEEDWRLAGTVMAVSDRTRTGIEETLRLAKRESNMARADAEGERAVVVSDKVDARVAKKIEQRIIRIIKASKDDGVTGATVRKALNSGQRHLCDDTLAALVEAGLITVEETEQSASGGGGPGRRYRSTP